MMTKKEMIEKAMEELKENAMDDILDVLRDCSNSELIDIANEYTDVHYYYDLDDLLENVCCSYTEAFELGQNCGDIDDRSDRAYRYDSWSNAIEECDIDELFDFEEFANDVIEKENDYGCDEVEDILRKYLDDRDDVEAEVERELIRQKEEYAKAIKLFGQEMFKAYQLVDADVINKLTESVREAIENSKAEKV